MVARNLRYLAFQVDRIAECSESVARPGLGHDMQESLAAKKQPANDGSWPHALKRLRWDFHPGPSVWIFGSFEVL